MKKNLLGVLAFASAITLTSFTVLAKRTLAKETINYRYAVYLDFPTGTTPQTNPENYIVPTFPPEECEGDTRLCWIRFDDFNNNKLLDLSELSAFFVDYDSDMDLSLDDESEIPGIMEKKY